MFNKHRKQQFLLYGPARDKFIADPAVLIGVEKFLAATIARILQDNIDEITADFNEATLLFPFWEEYPPDDRGRQPRGDQFPWIEVGEHVVTAKLSRFLPNKFDVKDPGLPTGPDARFLVRHAEIGKMTDGLTDAAFLMIDIKSVGPRDDCDHTVLSHNQVSGDGVWTNITIGVKNRVMKATGKRKSHPFHCTLPPLYVLSDGTIAPTVVLAVKPVYKMLPLLGDSSLRGQPLGRIDVIAVPNGLLLEVNPGYLSKYPGLLFPGKDDQVKNPLKVRSRISFGILRQIDAWRIETVPAR
jgi:hypothetical protein